VAFLSDPVGILRRMVTAFDGVVFVHYGQIYVVTDPAAFIDGFERALEGQVNGLLQAGNPGMLFLVTGLHTGDLRFTVEVHEAEPPPPGDTWEEVVEASLRPLTSDVTLSQWAGEESWPLPLETIDYRVRYCARGMDEGHDLDTPDEDEEVGPDSYLLQFWPAPPAPDRILRQTSQSAAYWHSEAPGTQGRVGDLPDPAR
jgi:hypothetical protein